MADQYIEMLPWHKLFVSYCIEKEVEIEISEAETLKAVKSYLGLQLFGENVFNEIKNQGDVFVARAKKLLDSLNN